MKKKNIFSWLHQRLICANIRENFRNNHLHLIKALTWRYRMCTKKAQASRTKYNQWNDRKKTVQSIVVYINSSKQHKTYLFMHNLWRVKSRYRKMIRLIKAIINAQYELEISWNEVLLLIFFVCSSFFRCNPNERSSKSQFLCCEMEFNYLGNNPKCW